MPLRVDNNGSIFPVVNPAHDRRTKHIDVRYHFCREFIEDGHAALFYIASADQRADIFTKPLPFSTFCKHRQSLGLVE